MDQNDLLFFEKTKEKTKLIERLKNSESLRIISKEFN